MSTATLFDDPEVLVVRRQTQLRVPLSATQAAAGADSDVAGRDARLLAAAAGLSAVRWIFDPLQLAALTGQPTPASIWGWSERGSDPPVVFVDLARCRYRGVALGVLAHELTHLTHYGRRYSGHKALWWTAVQQLLDRMHTP